MIEHSRKPGRRRMTVVAIVGTCDVCGRLTGRGRPIVATKARAGDRRMVNLSHRRPGCGAVAILTGVGRTDMRGRFTRRRRAVVTVRTGARCAAMVEHGRNPGRGHMAIIAGVGAGDMAGRPVAVVPLWQFEHLPPTA